MPAEPQQTPKLRYNLEAMLRSLKEQYPEIRSASPETLSQSQIGEVFAKRKQAKRSAMK